METRAVVIGVACGSLLGCDFAGAGVCSHTYREPVLIVAGVQDVRTGRPIAAVAIDSVTLNAQSTGVGVAAPAFGVVVDGTGVQCHVTCGFGTSPGQYVMRVSANGYAPKQIAVAATYAQFHGGCPSWNDGGTRVHGSLTPE